MNYVNISSCFVLKVSVKCFISMFKREFSVCVVNTLNALQKQS